MDTRTLELKNKTLLMEKKELEETISLLRESNRKLFVDNLMLKRKNDLLETKAEFLKLKSITDTYTGLYTKDAIKLQVEKTSNMGLNNILVIIDIDNFKLINDSFGHDKGDEILKIMSEILKSSLKGSDIASRFGGDEFVIFLRDINMENTLKLLNKIQNDLANISLDSSFITISVGVTKYCNDLTYDENFKRADDALYESKNTGKNKITIYSEKTLKKR